MNTELTTVILVGSLGRAVGRTEWQLDVKSPAEAVRAININTRGALERYLAGPARSRLYRIALQKRDNVIDAKEVKNRSGRSVIYVMPTIRGRNSGVGKVIAGIVLIIAAFYTGGGALSGFGSSFAAGGAGATFTAGILTAFGTSLVLGGISQLLAPTPQGPTASPDQARSTSFPGTAAAVVQGSCIPVVYGRALVAPIPISITVTNDDVSTTAAGYQGGVLGSPLLGGGIQYGPDIPDIITHNFG